MNARARITLPDLVFILMTLAFIGALYPVLWQALETRAPEMGTGTLYLFQLILPLGLLVVFAIVYTKATAGLQ